MRSEQAYFEPFVDSPGGFESYVDAMACGGVWGDDAELQAVAEIYGRPLVVLGLDEISGEARVVRETSGSGPPMRFCYYKGGHYDSLVPAAASATGAVAASSAPTIPATTPRVGECERRALELTAARHAGGESLALRQSDVLATDLAQLDVAVSRSRQAFDEFRAEQLQQALRESADAHVEDQVLRHALQVSLGEMSEDELLARALEASLHLFTGPGDVLDVGLDEDAMLQLAMQESLRQP
jgi:hypothetical protein